MQAEKDFGRIHSCIWSDGRRLISTVSIRLEAGTTTCSVLDSSTRKKTYRTLALLGIVTELLQWLGESVRLISPVRRREACTWQVIPEYAASTGRRCQS